MSADLGRMDRDRNLATVFTVPHRDSMSPPKLATNAPIANILHPVEVDLGELLRDDVYPAVFYGLDGRLGQRLGINEPLLAGPRLNRRAAPDAVSYSVKMRFSLE